VNPSNLLSAPLTLLPGNGNLSLHTEIGVSINSRYPSPILFFVSREAESEAKATYKPINCEGDQAGYHIIRRRSSGITLGRKMRRPSGYRVWFNPESDVIYFGSHSCLGNLVAFLKLGLPIERIAFDAEAGSDGNYSYCNCCETAIANKTCLQPFFGNEVDSIVCRLRILHGFTIAGSNENIFPGCPSLKEILLFMKTPGPFDPDNIYKSFPGWSGLIDLNPPECIDFERYTTERPHYPLMGQLRMSMDAYTDHVLATTVSPFSEENSAWKGGKKAPKFQLARFSKPLPAGYVFKFLVLNFSGEAQYKTFWCKARKISEHTIISTFPATYSGPGTCVLKLVGAEALVALQMEKIMEEGRKAQALYKQEIKILEPNMAVFSATLGNNL
jgi:hypothetical protein